MDFHLSKLPPEARAKLMMLRDEATEFQYRSKGVHDARAKARDYVRQLEDQIARMAGKRAQSEIAAVKSELEEAGKLLAEKETAASDASELATQAARLVNAVHDFVEQSSSLRMFKGTIKKLGGDPISGVERCREQISELREHLAKTEAAPITSTEAKQRMREQIAGIAVAGQPDVFGLIESGQPVDFPHTSLHSSVITMVGQTGTATGNSFDALSFLCWAFRDQIVKAFDAEIDRRSNDAEAISTEQRQNTVAQIKAEILTVERHEEALIVAASERGAKIGRRTDADPRAVLGLTDEEDQQVAA